MRLVAGPRALGTTHQGTPISADYHLRIFPIWRDQTFHGSTAIQLSGTAALEAAAQLRGQPGPERLARRQLQWVFGGNPFSQSLMYGEGYDYQPQFAYCLRDLVGSLPVGIDSRRDDTPCWPATNTATYKEIWVVPVSRLLLSLAYVAMPARVTGSAPAGALFRELHTGAKVAIPPGEFAVNLPPGDYEVAYGGSSRRVTLLAGARRELSLDAHYAIEVDLSARRIARAVVQLEARLRGAGEHRIKLRAFNAAIETPQTAVHLIAGREHRLTRRLVIADPRQPWAVVAIADGSMSGKTEIFGTP